MNKKNTSNDNIIKTMTERQLFKVSQGAIYAHDKYFRMFAGLSSDLIWYEDGIATIEVSFKEQYKPKQLAYKIAYLWQDWVKELKHADAFVVLLYSTSRPSGFYCDPPKEIGKERNDVIEDVFEQFKRECAKEEIKVLKGIYSDFYDKEISKSLNRGLTECKIDNHTIKESN